MARFNATATQLLGSFLEDDAASRSGVGADGWTMPRPTATQREQAFRVRTLVSLSRLTDKALTEAQAEQLLHHCLTTDTSDEPKWVEWGVLPPPPAFKADVRSERYAVSGRPAATYRAHLAAQDTENLHIHSYKGVEWAGVSFTSPGTYIVFANDLGIATRGRGDTRGRELTANWRVTVGTDVLSRTREGYSLAGEHHTRTPHGAWYYKAGAPLSLDTPFVLVVGATTVRLQQAGRLFFSTTKAATEPVLLAFKNVWLRINYKESEPEPVPAPTPRREPIAFGTAPSWSSVARTPAAVIAQLRARE